MSFHASYKRYWEPSVPHLMFVSTLTNSVATLLTFPGEYMKTKIQIRAEGVGIRQKSIYGGYNPFAIHNQLYEAGHGTKSLWTGFQAGYFSRVGGLFVRNLIYKTLYDMVKPRKATNDLTYDEKKVIAGIAGAAGAVFSNPFEIMMVRQISDLGRPAEFQRGYADMGDAYAMISKEAGFGIWRGLSAHVAKAVVLNTVMIGPYDMMQERVWNIWGETTLSKPIAILWASIFGAAFSLPFDNLKTRMQNQFSDPKLNRLTYAGAFDAARQMYGVEKLGAFPGFYTYYAKTVLYAFLTLYSTDMIFQWSKNRSGLPEHYI